MDFDRLDVVAGGKGLDAGNGQQVFHRGGQAAEAVAPCRLERIDGFDGEHAGEFAVGLEAQACVIEPCAWQKCGDRIAGILAVVFEPSGFGADDEVRLEVWRCRAAGFASFESFDRLLEELAIEVETDLGNVT